MITDTELLNYIRQTTLMGRTGIDGIMKYSACQPLTDALRQQRAEYGEICDAATKCSFSGAASRSHCPWGPRWAPP